MRDTYRELFGNMPPMTHDKAPEKSEVLAHIMRKMECDLAQASKVFGTIRHANKRILLFDGSRRVWYGERNLSAPDAIRKLRARCDAAEMALSDADARISAMEDTIAAMRKWARKMEGKS